MLALAKQRKASIALKSMLAWPLALHVTWVDFLFLALDLEAGYNATLPTCLAFIGGVAFSWLLERATGAALAPSAAGAAGIAGGLAGLLSLLVTAQTPFWPLTAASGLLCGLVTPFWVEELRCLPKESIAPAICVAGLMSSALLFACNFSSFLPAVVNAFAPMASGALLVVTRRRPKAASRPDASRQYHAPRPLYLVLLAIATCASALSSLQAFPFLVMSPARNVADALLGCLACLFLLLCPPRLRRKGAGVLFLGAFALLQAAVLLFSFGLVRLPSVPLCLIHSAAHLLTILSWAFAGLLACSSPTDANSRNAGVLLGLFGTGVLGRLAGHCLSVAGQVGYGTAQEMGVWLFFGMNALMIAAALIDGRVQRVSVQRHAEERIAQMEREAHRRIEMMEDSLRRNAESSWEERCEAVVLRFGLTQREAEAMRLASQGKSRSDIAQQWVVSENTVKYHLRNVYRKVGVHNARELSALVEKTSIEEPPRPNPQEVLERREGD